jgi:hypothetical protein
MSAPLSADESVLRGEEFDLSGMMRGFLDERKRRLKRFEGVADVLEFAVEVIVVAIEEVPQPFESL